MTALRLYNTLTRTKDDFVPIDPKNVRMYVCGPTVYDYAHIGNARPAIVFDVLFRLLRHVYGPDHVTYVRNITDIDDKINARALERRGDRNVPILDVVRELTEQTYGVYRDDVTALGCLPPSFMPRATENIAPMIAMTKTLIDNGHAYEASGHVLFDVSSKADYGKLARRSTDDMIAGARVDVAPYKKNPMDFVLWKPSDANTPGWDSPWGRGRPGWHLECSAMIEATFKGTDTIDIHGGGIDLVFPHHENEIAQSEGAHHEHPLAKVWMHNGFLNVEGEKMSKSLGNFVTINELLTTNSFGNRKWSGEVLRFAMLQTLYTQPIDWTVQLLEQSSVRLERWKKFASERTENRLDQTFFNLALEAWKDDLNFPKMFGIIDKAIGSPKEDGKDRYTVYRLLDLLGFDAPESTTLLAAKKFQALAIFFTTISEAWKGVEKEAERVTQQSEMNSSALLLAEFSALSSKLKEVLSEAGDLKDRLEIKNLESQILSEISYSKVQLEKVDVENLRSHIFDLTSALFSFSNNDWRNIFGNIDRSPTLMSGGPKSASRLIASLMAFDLMADAYRQPEPASWMREVSSLFLKNFLQTDEQGLEIERAIDARNAARKAKDFKESDRIRDELLAQGIVLKDGPNGTTWEVKK